MTDKLIERNPAILWGPPVFAGTRVPVRALMDYLALPHGIAEPGRRTHFHNSSGRRR